MIDLVGGDVAARSLAVLRPGGSLVSAVAPPDQAAAERLSVDARFFLVEVTTARLTRIAAMLDAGELQTNVGAILPLAAARCAHEMREGLSPRPRGTIMLRVAG